jgi:metal-responsive CopG/Arc/MetJ family transcriptional regulator
MVGELESLSKMGKRSEYIEKAIRGALNHRDGFDISSISTGQLLVLIINRTEGDSIAHKLLLILRELIG